MRISIALCLLLAACNSLPDAPRLASITPDGSIDLDAPIAPYILASGPQAMDLSPDGELVAYRAESGGIPVLHLVPAGGGEARVLTPEQAVTTFAWYPDSSALMFAADRDGNEQEGFYRLDIATGEVTTLLAPTDGGFRQFGAFAPDGSLFAYASTERNGLDYDVYVYDLATGESRLVREGRYGQYVEAVSPDGSTLVISTTVGEDGDNLYVVDIDTGEVLLSSEPEPRANHTDAGVAFDASGNSLYAATNVAGEFTEVVRYSLADGTTETLVGDDADIDQLELCGNGIAAFTYNRDGFSHVHSLDLATGRATPLLTLSDGVARIDCEAGRLAVLERAFDDPGTIRVVFTRGGDSVAVPTVTPDLAGLDPSKLVKPTSLTMTARDGVELQGLLYTPSGVDNPPVVFDVHGGPTAQSRPGWEPEEQYLVSRGIAVFQPNVRGSTGFGRTYTTLDDRELRRDSVRDLIDMLESPELGAVVDTSRAAVRGGSYGGYMVNAMLAEYPDAFDAGVSLFGVGDWITALEVASPALKASDLIEYGDITQPRWRAFYAENSPVRIADRIRVPVLYSHGEMDPRIDIAETEVMVRALRENGVEAEFIRIPDEGHGWRKTTNRMFYAVREADFLERHLAD